MAGDRVHKANTAALSKGVKAIFTAGLQEF
jgi:hypothetical protein